LAPIIGRTKLDHLFDRQFVAFEYQRRSHDIVVYLRRDLREGGAAIGTCCRNAVKSFRREMRDAAIFFLRDSVRTEFARYCYLHDAARESAPV
jgi:hypothetical protein